MKQRLNKVLYIFIFAFLSGCANSYEKLEVSGQLVDVVSRKPISDIKIYFRKLKYGFPLGSWETFHTVTTGVDGKFVTSIEVNDDVDVMLDISSPWIYIKHEDYHGKHKIHLMMYGSIELKDMATYENIVTFEQ